MIAHTLMPYTRIWKAGRGTRSVPCFNQSTQNRFLNLLSVAENQAADHPTRLILVGGGGGLEVS